MLTLASRSYGIRKEISCLLFQFFAGKRHVIANIHGHKHAIIVSNTLKDIANYVLLNGINSKTGQCYYKQETIAEKLGYSRKTVNEKLKELKLLGILDWKHTRKDRETTDKIGNKCIRSLWAHNIYFLKSDLIQRLRKAIKDKWQSIPPVINLGGLFQKSKQFKGKTFRNTPKIKKADFPTRGDPPDTPQICLENGKNSKNSPEYSPRKTTPQGDNKPRCAKELMNSWLKGGG